MYFTVYNLGRVKTLCQGCRFGHSCSLRKALEESHVGVVEKKEGEKCTWVVKPEEISVKEEQEIDLSKGYQIF